MHLCCHALITATLFGIFAQSDNGQVATRVECCWRCGHWHQYVSSTQNYTVSTFNSTMTRVQARHHNVWLSVPVCQSPTLPSQQHLRSSCRTVIPAECVWLTGFLCGWSVSPNSLHDGRHSFRQLFKTTHWRIQHVRGSTMMHYINITFNFFTQCY